MSGREALPASKSSRWRPVRLCALANAVALLAGCRVGPDYTRPEVAAPPAYKELTGWKAAQAEEHPPGQAWWQVFNDSELNALEERVSISNQDLVAAEAQLRQARALVQAARAAYFPAITLGASYSRSRSSSGRTQGVFNPGGTSSNFLLHLEASWEADLWGRIRRTVEANLAGAQASAADLEAARLAIQADLAQSYFQLRGLDAQKQILESTLAAYRKSLELTQNRYSGGVAARVDVLQADTQLKTTLTQSIDLGVQRAQLEHSIALLVGAPPSVFSLPAAPLPAMVPAIPVGLPSELLERRPDIAAAERRVAAANARIGVAVAAYFPQVTLTASGGFEGTSLSRWLEWPSRFWSVGPGITETVYQGGLRRAQTDEARAAHDAAVASYRQTVLTAFQEVEDNLAALRILEEEARAAADALQAAQQAVTLAINQYRAGTLNYLSVIIVQATALSNERTTVDIQSRRLIAGAVLIKALGGPWNTPQGYSAQSSASDEGSSPTSGNGAGGRAPP